MLRGTLRPLLLLPEGDGPRLPPAGLPAPLPPRPLPRLEPVDRGDGPLAKEEEDDVAGKSDGGGGAGGCCCWC